MPDTPPTVSLALDKTSGMKGDPITATVRYTPGSRTSTATVTVTDATGATGTATVNLVSKAMPVTVKLADSEGRTWTPVSDDGAVAVFKATV